MYILTISDQTDHTETGPLVCYDNTDSDKYLSDLSSYSDNESDLRLDNYNNYKSNYKSNNKEALYISTSITDTLLVQLSNIKERNVKYDIYFKVGNV